MDTTKLSLNDLETALALSAQAAVTGIGMQRERTLHSVLKFVIDADADHHEIPIGAFIADIYHRCPKEVFEIQTGSFGPLRKKLEVFLAEMPVTIVYPIIERKRLIWVDPDTGENAKARTSPKRGHLFDVLPELYRISDFLGHPNLSLLPILIDVDEFRLQDGWSRDKKRGSHRADRLPTRIGTYELVRPSCPGDIAKLLPEIASPFYTADFAKATRFSPRETSYALSVLRSLGICEVVGKEKNKLIYRLCDAK